MINKIRDNIKNNVGNRVKILYNGSRNKKEDYVGIINEFYNNIFIVKLDTGEVKSFSYSDILTNTIEIFFVKK